MIDRCAEINELQVSKDEFMKDERAHVTFPGRTDAHAADFNRGQQATE